jgi:hypothetical protein
MDQEEQKAFNGLLGCAMVSWSLFVTAPMWLVLLFSILRALGDSLPVWAWVLYWVYVPATVLGIILTGIAKSLLESK